MRHAEIEDGIAGTSAAEHRVSGLDEFLGQRPAQTTRHSRQNDFHAGKVASSG
jgi:hypothetical protein